jgi:nucleotide-binding universal stress UspA family protein
MLLSVALVTLLYALVMLVTTGVVPFTELRDSLVPVSDVAVVFMGSVGVVAIVAAAAIAAISSSNSSILAAARVNFAMGRDALMSDRLNVTHDRFGTPHRAIVATGAITALLIGAGLQIQAIVALLAEVASFSFLVSYSLVHVALVVFRRADPDEYDPSFRIPGRLYPAVPVLGILLTVLVISQMAPVIILLGLGLVGLGAGWYVVYARDHAIDTGLFREAFPRPLGGTAAEQSDVYRVVVPVANPDTQRDLIRLAAASAHAHAEEATPELVAVNVLQVAGDSTQQNVAAERLDHQHDLLEAAREIAAEMDVSLRTRAVTGQRVDERIVEVLTEEQPDQALIGWQGTPPEDGSLFSPNLDAVVAEAPCELSVVTFHDEVIGTPVALAGPGPHSPVAARRAVDFATVEGTTPTLLNVQRPGDDERAAVARGEAAIADVAGRAGLDPAAYDVAVVVDDDVEAAILDAVDRYGTVCVGLSEQSETSRLMFGTIAERISQEATSNVGIARRAYDEPADADAVERRAVGEPV